MDKHKAWATTIVAPKSVGSSTTKGQMKPAFRVSLTASQAGENGQINAPEHTNQIVQSLIEHLSAHEKSAFIEIGYLAILELDGGQSKNFSCI